MHSRAKTVKILARLSLRFMNLTMFTWCAQPLNAFPDHAMIIEKLPCPKGHGKVAMFFHIMERLPLLQRWEV